jgi:nucleotide-binding universal stress UspA family protein
MSGIVCAIRGGPRSKRSIARAIKLVKEKELPLYFLYVVNLDFLSRTESSGTRVISSEMHEMGEFILSNAQAKAGEEGVHANCVVRQGEVTDEIVAFAKQIDADYIILGQPKGTDKEDFFTMERLNQFVQRLSQDSGAQVIMTEEEEEKE